MAEADHFDAIIIGGGAAGLAAAVELVRADRRCVLIEASNRLGGRVLTLHDQRLELPVELGAEFLHGHVEPTWSLASKADAKPYEIPHDHRQRLDRRLIRLDFGREMQRVMERLQSIGKHDMSFAQFLDQYCAEPELAHARQLATAFVEGFDAADPQLISAKSLASEWQGVGNVAEQPQYRLERGYGALIDRLHTDLMQSRAAIAHDLTKTYGVRLSTRAFEIDWRPSHVVVQAQAASGASTFMARTAIIAVPLHVLQSTSGPQHLRFNPELPDKREAALKLGFGSVVKVVLGFREPFWRDDAVAKAAGADESFADACFLHHHDSPFPTWWTLHPLQSSMLTAWAGGPKAAKLAGKSEHELLSIALDALSQLFSVDRKTLDSLLIAGCARDWSKEPHIRGAYSYELVNAGEARRHLAEPVEDTLFLAGEATSIKQSATVAGALESGRDAARNAAQAL